MDLTIENFTEQTGFRFRVTREQQERIAAGTLTREQAFTEFLESGGLERLRERTPEIPDSIFLSTDLTLDNFASRVKEATGTARRFRISRDQKERIESGSLTREQAFAEFVEQRRAAINLTPVEPVSEEDIAVSETEYEEVN